MRDDLLKEQLMSYARTAAEEAAQPDAAPSAGAPAVTTDGSRP